MLEYLIEKGEIRFNDSAQSLTSPGVVKKDLLLLQSGEAPSHSCNIETHRISPNQNKMW